LTLAIMAPLFAVSAASAATVYSETSNGANPALTVTGTAPNGEAIATQGGTASPTNTVILDNVVVPSYNGGAGGLIINSVTVNDRQLANAPATTLQLYYSTIVTDRSGATVPVISAPTAVGSPVAIGANGATSVNTPVVFNTPFTLSDSQLNFTDPSLASGAEFYLGYKFSTTGTDQGLCLAEPDTGYVNPLEYYEYNTATNGQTSFTFFAQNDPNDGGGVWVTVDATVVPEPATLGLAALGGLMFLARRPGRKS
jgi:hypothetical protein